MSKNDSTHSICADRNLPTREAVLELSKEKGDPISQLYETDLLQLKKNFRACLENLGILQAHFAKMLEVDKSIVLYWLDTENNRTVGVANVADVCRIIGCTCSEFLLAQSRAIKAPKRIEFLYEAIQNSTNLSFVEKWINSKEPAPISTGLLIRDRLLERAEDASMHPNEYYEDLMPRLGIMLRKILGGKEFQGRLASIFMICLLSGESADYLLTQDYSNCEITIKGKPVQDKYRKTIGKFLGMSENDQNALLGALVKKQTAIR